MNIKDCKTGTRVVCVECDDDAVPVGAVGTIIENDTPIPWVSFDELYGVEQKEVYGYPNCKVMELDELAVLKEASSKETNIAKLTVSLSTEDANEIATDILKIVLKDLNVIISDAIDSLELNNTESSSMQTDTNVVTEDSILTNLLNLIEKATADGDLESLLNLTAVYQRMKSASTI